VLGVASPTSDFQHPAARAKISLDLHYLLIIDDIAVHTDSETHRPAGTAPPLPSGQLLTHGYRPGTALGRFPRRITTARPYLLLLVILKPKVGDLLLTLEIPQRIFQLGQLNE
jgi:hypothetical protein